jgi:hypothetical protein
MLKVLMICMDMHGRFLKTFKVLHFAKVKTITINYYARCRIYKVQI